MWRARKRASLSPGADDAPRRFAYADPPYPGFADLYRGHADYGGEVDHEALVASLTAAGYAGWALSTSSKTLAQVLPHCPPGARVAAWVKPIGVSGLTYGMHSTWEPVIVVGGRQLRPGVRDWVQAQPAKLGGHDLVGRKPDAFCQAVFRWLGMRPGDILDDLFPGSGAVMRSWVAVGGCPGDRTWPASFTDPSATPVAVDVSDAGVARGRATAVVGARATSGAAPSSVATSDAPSLLEQRHSAMLCGTAGRPKGER